MSEPDPVLVTLLQATVNSGASDLHITVGRAPTARRDGTLVSFENVKVLDTDDTVRMVMSLLDEGQERELQDFKQVDFSFGIPGLGRFRANAFHQRNSLALALRVIPFRVRSLEELGAPRSATTLLNKPYGLVLAVGPTGSGKSTTLAAMIDRINETKPVHILTIEDPVEYLHHHKVAMVNQREVGTDAVSFEQGLRSALREDPDVVLLGEMRDLESIQIALSLAETGHLVFATLHTNDASQALDRMIDVFPSDKRDQIQTMLAGALQGVVSQRLLPAVSGGRVAAYEVLMGTEAVRNLVREGKSRQLRNVVATGGPEGMQTIEMDLARLVTSGLVTMEMAQSISQYPGEIQAQVSTLRAQAQAQATQAAGQAATSGSGVRAGEETTAEPGDQAGDAAPTSESGEPAQPAAAG
jgi:twitching motility protein PilT